MTKTLRDAWELYYHPTPRAGHHTGIKARIAMNMYLFSLPGVESIHNIERYVAEHGDEMLDEAGQAVYDRLLFCHSNPIF